MVTGLQLGLKKSEYFPVREKSDNFDTTEEIRQFYLIFP